MTGRLIINARGESARAEATDGGVRVQMTALADNVTLLPVPATHIPSAWSESRVEVTFANREAVALALQILDAAGYCAAVAPKDYYKVDMGQITPRR